MARISRKELKKDEFVEAAFDLQHWLEHNWRTLVLVAAPILLIVLGAVAWINVSARAEQKNRDRLARAVHEFQQAEADGFADFDRLATALDGFESCAEADGNGSTGQVARYYRGVTLHRLGRTDEAIEALDSVQLEVADSPTMGAAKALLADLLVETGQVERAVQLLSGYAADGESGYPPDLALLQLGRILKEQGSEEEARQNWNRILEEHPDGAAAREASRLLGS